MSSLDPRLTPARPDLAASSLRGTVVAERFVDGRRMQVSASLLDLKRRPRNDAPLDTQLLHGEMLTLYEEADGWGWVQAERDGYVGYVATHGLCGEVREPTHEVAVARTFVYPVPDMKQPVRDALPLAAQVRIEAHDGPFAKLAAGGWVWREHLAGLETAAGDDPVRTAETLVGAPYLWGGRSPRGIDCSGLVQLGFGMAGIALPRDTHMQQACGEPIERERLRRGDLVFWPGHVAIMRDEIALIHASGYQMLVLSEPLEVVESRIASGPGGSPVVAMRRIAC